MKKILWSLAVALTLNSCSQALVVESTPKRGTPGQIKKATGSQSARPYAPVHQEKKL